MNPIRFFRHRLKRKGLAGLGVGALALLVCELPIIIAIFGFGSLGVESMRVWGDGLSQFVGLSVELVAVGLSIGLALATGGFFLLVRTTVKRWRAASFGGVREQQ